MDGTERREREREFNPGGVIVGGGKQKAGREPKGLFFFRPVWPSTTEEEAAGGSVGGRWAVES